MQSSASVNKGSTWYYRGPRSFNPVSVLRGKWFDAVHASSPPHDLVCRVDGCRLRVRSDSVLARALYVGAGFEESELSAFRTFLRPGLKVLDVGANIGLYTVLSAKAVGDQGHVWSFEPFAGALAYLRQNLALNGLGNVTVVGKAVADTVGQSELYVFPDGAEVYNSLGARQRPAEHLQSAGAVPVEVTTLDAFAESAGLASVDLIKIDVEGAEERVIAGAQGLLNASKDVTLLIELYEPSAAQCGCSTQRLIASLQSRGFTLFTIEKRGKMRPATREKFSGMNAVFRRSLPNSELGRSGIAGRCSAC